MFAKVMDLMALLVVVSLFVIVGTSAAQNIKIHDSKTGGANLDIITSVPRTMTYQGIMKDDTGEPLNGIASVTFAVFDVESGGTSLWSEVVDVEFTDGLFTAILGLGVPLNLSFDTDYYLEIGIGGETLSPRQKITMSAYAAKADTADYALNVAGGSSLWDTSGSVLYTNDYWGIARGGANNSLYGSNANTMVNLGSNSVAGESGQDWTYATVSGGDRNSATHGYSTVGGGEGNSATSTYTTVGGGLNNEATAGYAVVGGGHDNDADGSWSTVGGGGLNEAQGQANTIAGGTYNTTSNKLSTIGGGSRNDATDSCSTVGGGKENTASGAFTFIGGGYSNLASDTAGVIAGGWDNTNSGKYSSIIGGTGNSISAAGDYSFLIGKNSSLTQANTFMVDTDNIRFGDESTGYEFPNTSAGGAGYILLSNGDGDLEWVDYGSRLMSLLEIRELFGIIEDLQEQNADLGRRVEELEQHVNR